MIVKRNPFTLLDFIALMLFIILVTLFFYKCAPYQESKFYTEPDTYTLPSDTTTFSEEEIDVEDTYEEDCYRTQHWFCPPLDAVWQMAVTIDICTDPHTIIEMGECEEYFECDPTIYEQGEEDCTTTEGYPGTQKIYCNKGMYEYGTCTTPCVEEICDWLDNDCDGQTDEGQRNACDECGAVPSETCDGLDNNCNGLTDESLFQQCSTACGSGIEYCVSGHWISCTAPSAEKESCNGLDDDCDGQTDEGLSCGCMEEEAGLLVPCNEDPLICGQGFKSCECLDDDCKEMTMTECKAACYYYPQLDPDCNPLVGMELEKEVCNNFDDNCNHLIDEDLVTGCYSGPDGTLNEGICVPGEFICESGMWGNDKDGIFEPGYCSGEVLPETIDHCNGIDDDCNGDIDGGKQLTDTDILFIVDWSGSMNEEIKAVRDALSLFATHFADEEVIQWALIVGPTRYQAYKERLILHSDLVPFEDFITALTNGQFTLDGSMEMLYDALYLSIADISSAPLSYVKGDTSWTSGVGSKPEIADFNISWRPDSNRVIVIFTDEVGQSFLDPKTTQDNLISIVQGTENLKVYTITTTTAKNGPTYNPGQGWEPIANASSGKWFQLTTAPASMYAYLLEILDENICE